MRIDPGHRLPTLEEAAAAAAANEAFKHYVESVEGGDGASRTLHSFSYGLAKLRDFRQPLPDRPEVDAFELRGLSFLEHPDGSVSRHLMLRKFFARGETEGWRERELDALAPVSARVKEDGFCVRFLPVGGRHVARTTGTAHNPHARLAQGFLEDPALREFLDAAAEEGLAPVFEVVGPSAPVVVPPANDRDRLKLVQLRDESGAVIPHFEEHPAVDRLLRNAISVDAAPNLLSPEERLPDLAERMRDPDTPVEGRVVVLEDGRMVKLKTDWYEDLHDVYWEKRFNDKILIRTVLNGTWPHVRPHVPEGVDVRRADAAAAAMHNILEARFHAVRSFVDAFHGDPSSQADKKAFAAASKGEPHLQFAMRAISKGLHGNAGIRELLRADMANNATTLKKASRFVESIVDPAHASSATTGA